MGVFAWRASLHRLVDGAATLRIALALGVLLAVAMPLSQGVVRAQDDDASVLIASEPFVYEPGNVSGLDGGEGWAAPWETSPLTPRDNTITAAHLTFADRPVPGNQMTTTGGDIRSFRALDTTRPAVTDLLDASGKFGKAGTTIWIGFLMRLSDGPNTNRGNGGLHLYDGVGDLTRDPIGEKAVHERVLLGDRNSATTWYLERTTGGGPGGGHWDSDVTVTGDLTFLAYRFDFLPGSVTVRLFIDPAADGTPDDATAAFTAADVSPFVFDYVEIGSGSGDPIERLDLAQLRVATTFALVVPETAV